MSASMPQFEHLSLIVLTRKLLATGWHDSTYPVKNKQKQNLLQSSESSTHTSYLAINGWASRLKKISLRTCVCMFACLDRLLTVNLNERIQILHEDRYCKASGGLLSRVQCRRPGVKTTPRGTGLCFYQ